MPERPDHTDLIATARYMRTASEAEAIETLLAFRQAWHEADIRRINESIGGMYAEALHRLQIIAK